MAGDEIGDLLLIGVVAKSVDGVKGLAAELLAHEVAGDDDGEEDEKESERRAGVGAANFCCEPVVGALADDREDHGSDERGVKRIEEKSAEDESGEGEEEEGSLLPNRFFGHDDWLLDESLCAGYWDKSSLPEGFELVSGAGMTYDARGKGGRAGGAAGEFRHGYSLLVVAQSEL